MQLKKFPDIPSSTQEEAREYRPYPEETRFRLIPWEEGSFPWVAGKNSWLSLPISRGGALHRKGERNSRVVPPFPDSPRCLSPFRETCFPWTASTFKPRSTHTSAARGTALWESLVGKPQGKASRESHRTLDPREGKRDTAATAREESAGACPHSRRGLTPLGRPQKNLHSLICPQIPIFWKKFHLRLKNISATFLKPILRNGEVKVSVIIFKYYYYYYILKFHVQRC